MLSSFPGFINVVAAYTKEDLLSEITSQQRQQLYQALYQYGQGANNLASIRADGTNSLNRYNRESSARASPTRPLTEQEFLLEQRETPASLTRAGEDTVNIMIATFYRDTARIWRAFTVEDSSLHMSNIILCINPT